jgi:dual specificity phosphatase 12
LKRRQALTDSNITHILSILSQQVDDDLVKDYTHQYFPVDDVEDEDILQYFPASNTFIKNGLQTGGGVLVHW